MSPSRITTSSLGTFLLMRTELGPLLSLPPRVYFRTGPPSKGRTSPAPPSTFLRTPLWMRQLERYERQRGDFFFRVLAAKSAKFSLSSIDFDSYLIFTTFVLESCTGKKIVNKFKLGSFCFLFCNFPTNIGITRATPMAMPLVVISDGVEIWLH